MLENNRNITVKVIPAMDIRPAIDYLNLINSSFNLKQEDNKLYFSENFEGNFLLKLIADEINCLKNFSSVLEACAIQKILENYNICILKLIKSLEDIKVLLLDIFSNQAGFVSTHYTHLDIKNFTPKKEISEEIKLINECMKMLEEIIQNKRTNLYELTHYLNAYNSLKALTQINKPPKSNLID